jgi:hypothetical protein
MTIISAAVTRAKTKNKATRIIMVLFNEFTFLPLAAILSVSNPCSESCSLYFVSLCWQIYVFLRNENLEN